MSALRTIAGLILCGCFLGACERAAPKPAADSFEILTPPTPATPRINGAKIFGVRPGAPFLFQIAATGERPMEFRATNLPNELSLDSPSGQISGVLSNAGTYSITLTARNRLGIMERKLSIIAGEEIALTPPLGWNSWNIWGGNVTQEQVRAAAHALVASGLRDHGWTYVNIDDGWQGLRGGEFNAIQPNKKFSDMPALANEIHTLGLKFGIYSTPWRTSFHGHVGSSADFEDGSNEWTRSRQYTEFFNYKFEPSESSLDKIRWLKPLADRLDYKRRTQIRKQLRIFGKFSFVRQDVAQWKAWGVDYLKYDWVPIDVAHAEEMRAALRATSRDIVFSVANNAPFPIAAQISQLANSWRTSGDVKDKWSDVAKVGFTRDRWAPFSRPGHYNDPDMLVLGEIGWGKPRHTGLSSNEQYTQMSLWCLLSAPLFLGCDLEKLDPFTSGLITNDEVIEIDQDPLCKQATLIKQRGQIQIYAKPLEDGSWAAGLFNRGDSRARATLQWSDLGISGERSLRDVWRQTELGTFSDRYETEVPPHGVTLIRISSASTAQR